MAGLRASTAPCSRNSKRCGSGTNNTWRRTPVLGVEGAATTMSEKWYWSKAGTDERKGPIDRGELRTMAADGRLAPGDLVWRNGMSAWFPAERINGLCPAKSEPPPLPPQKDGPPPLPTNSPETQAGGTGRGQRKSIGRRGVGKRSSATVSPKKAGLDGLPTWAQVLIVIGFILAISAIRIACERDAGSRRPSSGSYSAPPSLPPGVTEPDLWAQVLRAYPNASRQDQLAMYQMLLNTRIQQERQRAIRRMYEP